MAKRTIEGLCLLLGAVILLGGVSCVKKKKGVELVPLGLAPGVKPQAIMLTEKGAQAYQGRQFEDAKNYFSQAVSAAPDSGQAHYNFALALNALGETAEARRHFIDAANLAPGDKVIWNSPPLSPYGNPESQIKNTIPQQIPGRRGGPGGGGGGYP